MKDDQSECSFNQFRQKEQDRRGGDSHYQRQRDTLVPHSPPRSPRGRHLRVSRPQRQRRAGCRRTFQSLASRKVAEQIKASFRKELASVLYF